MKTLPPFAHAKLALLGTINWTEKHPAGGVDDYVWFKLWRLWVSSANLTFPREPAQGSASGRRPDLVNGAFELLVALIAASEDLDSAEDSPDPELAVVESDDKAMADAAAEMYEARREQAAR